MQKSGYQTYRAANISTADRGKLVIMIYDHCIKWCKIARETMQSNELEKATKAVFRVQDGITELTCALDMDRGGEIAHNLFNLYSFYNQHLSAAIREKNLKRIQDVETMLSDLRKSWLEAVEIVRRENRDQFQEKISSHLKVVG